MKIERYLPRKNEPTHVWCRRVSRRLGVLSLDNAKLVKGAKGDNDGEGAIDAALMLAPANTSGYEVCRHACEGCRAHCVAFSNNGRYASVLEARRRRTRLFFEDRGGFAGHIAADLTLLAELAGRLGVSLALRPNAFSDLPWERITLFDDGWTLVDLARAWGVILYDYTKDPRRSIAQPYRLTHSRTNETPEEVAEYLARGVNVAIPFWPRVPRTWFGMPVFDGDQNDRRYLDPAGVIVGLRTKNTASRDATGFVVRETRKPC